MTPNRKSGGPVTLVVDRQHTGGGMLSWTFSTQEAAMSVACALRSHEPWVLVLGAFSSAAHALEAARSGARVAGFVETSPGVRNCPLPPAELKRASRA